MPWLRRFLFSASARRAWGLICLLATGAVLALAWLPSPPGPSLGWDKANHTAAFAVLSFTGLLAMRERKRPAWWVGGLLMLLGITIELGQALVPSREADWHDVMANTLGIAAGLLVSTALTARLDRRRQRRGPQG
jgi:VanZ family protein